jgi:uncharacterized protein with HEPN domain
VRSDRERLIDILESIQLIEKYAAQGQKKFEESDLIQNWMVHHIQIIGEAAARLTQRTRAAYSKIPWTEIIGMRNILVHDYFGIDTEAIWNTVEKHIPDLKAQVENILQDFLE